jgi:acyl carrier protein
MKTQAYEDILKILRSIINEMKPNLPQAIPEKDTFKKWGLDSLDQSEFVARLEQHYKMEIPDQDWDQLISLDETIKYLMKSLLKHV